MYSRPVIVGHELSLAEQRLVQYWLEQRPDFRRLEVEEIAGGEMGLLYVDAGDEASVRELLGWHRPVLVILGAGTHDPEAFLAELDRAGVAAVWQLGDPDNTAILLPTVDYPRRGSVYLLDDSQARRRRYRQLLFFCGFDPRIDFRDSGDLLTALGERFESTDPGTGDAPPALLLIDLDSTRLDARAFFPALRKFYSEVPGARGRTQLMLTKDFRRTGTDLELLAAHIRPLARRIFAPDEAIFALLEGLLYAGVRADGAGSTGAPAALGDFTPRELRDLLTGENVQLHKEYPARLPNLELTRHAQLFAWLYARARADSGVLLSGDRQQ